MRVAVIGTGIAGNAAAWTLSKRYPVTVYDREFRPGGHSHTVTIDYDGAQVAVDIGFIVYNQQNYPELTALFDHLGVETVESCMSFAVTADQGRFEWKGGGETWLETAKGLFAQRRNILSTSYLWMLRDILTFNQKSVEDYKAGRLEGLTLGAYFERCFTTPNTGKISWEQVYANIREVGPASTILATDLGQTTAPYPDEGLANFMGNLLDQGFAEKDVQAMVRDNPAQLLGAKTGAAVAA